MIPISLGNKKINLIDLKLCPKQSPPLGSNSSLVTSAANDAHPVGEHLKMTENLSKNPRRTTEANMIA